MDSLTTSFAKLQSTRSPENGISLVIDWTKPVIVYVVFSAAKRGMMKFSVHKLEQNWWNFGVNEVNTE